MTRRFGAQCIKNGYAAMGNAIGRPRYKGMDHTRTIADSIAAERAKAARMANASKKKK